ncbi:MAG TPA: hypothetical protein VFN10_08660 [Thermoanaerobaculia bacterium]|nr:hypothetical protein [Thermoanaerobaculia bacterium]
MNIPFFSGRFDERFLMHRLRSTSIAGVTGGTLAMLLFAYRFYHDHVWNWDLFSVGLTMAVLKVSLMTYYRRND